MYQIAQNFTLRITLSFSVCATLLLLPGVPLLVSEASQGQSAAHSARPRHKKPEGTFPNLEDVKSESSVEREALAPIPSTTRSPKLGEKPWNGRRVGDPETPPDQAEKKMQRAHARRRINPAPPPMYEDQFIQNFFNLALLRGTTYEETLFWNYQLRAAFNQSQTSLKLAAIELGKTVFESASYAARSRSAHWYVYDLYKTYLMREPDASGWTYWENQVVPNGRENVRRGFEEATEFATLLSTIVLSGPAGSNPASLITARVEPRNQPGLGMLTRDANWSVSLISLPGRNGLDLGLALAYSSMVWTPSGPYFHFDEDNGFPSPGFRLGFPIVQRKVFNAQTAKNAYLLITPSGRRVELRQVGASGVYEAGDSSYLQLIESGANLLVRSTDGTQLSFVELNNEFSCTQVKDRNGNYITINYNPLGRIASITDTLGRVITFNYDNNQNLLSITQAWNGQPTHQWVSFGWSTRNMQYSFPTDKVIGTSAGAVIPVITQVALNDTSSFTFEYSNPLQVSVIRNYFDNIERNATTFGYETASGDVPRLASSSVWGRNWTGYNNVPAQVTTQYSVAGDGACVLTAPDGTIYKQYYGAGWQKGLTTASEIWSGGVKQKWTTTTWTQDNTSLGYKTNPRVTETNVYDAGGNRRRTVIDYGQYAQWGLPYLVKEYAADGVTEIRNTFTDYNLSQAYLDRRLIGLVSDVHLTNGSSFQSKITYGYDDPARLAALPASATQHDTAYNASLTARGNVTSVSRWDVTDINNASKKLTSYTSYFVTGTPASATDPGNHQSSLSYTDAFSDNLVRNTFAYPTTLTDADGNSSTVQYNFDFGATTRTQSPAPANQTQGAVQTFAYNNLGQLERVTTTNNGAYKRFWYGAEFTASYATVNNVADEAYTVQYFDGMGRIVNTISNHPGSTGGYRIVNSIYDQMGRVWLQSNPTEVNSSILATGDDAAGIYYTQQTYDWKGRPLITTNPDSTTKTASYSGCGCAGGEVVTLTDEGTIDGGVAKRRQQKIYSDVLGRTVKTEVLNWQNGSVYSTTVNTYNVRDQVTQVRQYAGAEGSSTYQDSTMTYDGYGRLKTEHKPEQSASANTVWDYNADDTIQKITDGRGAATNYTYNQRHLLTGVSYSSPSGSQIPVPGAITYEYDAASNRTLMTDGTGSRTYSYDSLSRMTSESRILTGFSGTYTLNYSYNLAGVLSVLSIPFRSQQIGYNYDQAGRLSGVTANGFSASYTVWPNQYTQPITNFVSDITYRAWGARKSTTYGNTTSEQFTYNARLLPATYTLNNVNHRNLTVCCPNPTYSTMTWSYDYFNDGRIKSAWDSTNNWFDRAYTYDHVGRLKEAFTYRRARGLSPYPATQNPDPYYQNMTYDAFNHLSRTGLLYTGQPSDAGTWFNNRRTDSGWQYDADGNTTVDPNFTQTLDAAGKPSHSVSFDRVGNGANYPYQPRSDIAQTYDGVGASSKRIQISRQPDVFDEEAPPIEDTQTTYYLRSTVLEGVAVVELNGPRANDIVNIYVGGQRIAREKWGSVSFEQTNPVTGSLVISHGHPNNRTTTREERDSFGAEIPDSNPYPTQDYGGYKFGEQMYIEGGDPFDYSTGREIDGIPVSEAEFQRRVENGSVVGDVSRGGRHIGSINLAKHMFFSRFTVTFDVFRPSTELINHPELWYSYYARSYEEDVELSGVQTIPDQKSSQPQKPNATVIGLVNGAFASKDCQDFMRTMLKGASTKNNPVLEDGDIQKIFADFLAQIKGGVSRQNLVGARYGTVHGRIGVNGDGDGTIHSNSNPSIQDLADASTIINELPHLAGVKGGWPSHEEYDDFGLAQALHATSYDSKSTLRGRFEDDPRRVARWPNQIGPMNPFEAFPEAKSAGENRYDKRWSSYVHDLLMQNCRMK
ncbi:MAG TPA: DUF4214 domain-containing protein [Pyrinomonadaceae bacterium]|nr:DUF4214 domain-containing protein [Pyrinomonadaceae bacterium]